MSRFSIPTVLKRVPRQLLAQFFESYGHKELVELCSELQPVDSEQILLTMEDLAPISTTHWKRVCMKCAILPAKAERTH